MRVRASMSTRSHLSPQRTSGGKGTESNQFKIHMKTSAKKFVACLNNKGYEVSLEPRKIYQALPDPDAARHRQLRVVDESGDDYLYPASYFASSSSPSRCVRQYCLPSNRRFRPTRSARHNCDVMRTRRHTKTAADIHIPSSHD